MNYDINEMTPKDIENVIAYLQTLLGDVVENKNTISKVVKQEIQNLECPKCHCSNYVIKSGFTKNKTQRYLCKKCNKKFISTTNTLCYRTKLSFGN